MGTFIAALRKSKGMTQQEMADHLNVSNRTISKWECGEGYPEITMVPVIADLFDVTSDEILRGSRQTQVEHSEKQSKQSEKQVLYLLDKSVLSFKNKAYLSILVNLIGFIMLITISYGFYAPIIAVGITWLLLASSIVFLIVHVNQLIPSFENTLPYVDKINHLNKQALGIYRLTHISLSLSLWIMVLSLPFVFIRSQEIRASVVAFDVFLSLIPFLLIVFFILKGIIKYFVDQKLAQQTVWTSLLILDKRHSSLFKRFVLVGVVLMILMFITQVFISQNLSNLDTISFDTTEAFDNYLESYEQYEQALQIAIEQDALLVDIHRYDELHHRDQLVHIKQNIASDETTVFYRIREFDQVVLIDRENKIVKYIDYPLYSRRLNLVNRVFLTSYHIIPLLLMGFYYYFKRQLYR